MDCLHDGRRLPTDEEPGCPNCDGTGMIPEQKITELGCAGHLIVSHMCRWRRHTQVGNYRVSTVGNYYPDEKRRAIGYPDDSYFETMVFKTTGEEEDDNEGCGCQEVKEWCELDSQRYATAGRAQAGHEGFVRKYKFVCTDCNGTGDVRQENEEIPYR